MSKADVGVRLIVDREAQTFKVEAAAKSFPDTSRKMVYKVHFTRLLYTVYLPACQIAKAR